MPFFVRFIIFLSSPHPTVKQLIFVRFADEHGNYFPSSMDTIRLQVGITSFRSLNRSSRTCKEADSLRLKPFFPAQTLFSNPFSPHSLTHLRHFHCLAKATDPHPHHHDRHHGHNHHHHHQHDHGGHAKLTRAQEAFLLFAETIWWTDLADFLREHLELCCCAMALFIATAACAYLLPKPAVKPLRRVFILIAFPLVGGLRQLRSNMFK